MASRIELLVNKNWETEPVLSALTNPKLRPQRLPFPSVINTPRDGDNRMGEPRAVYELEHITVIVRCIEDLMDPKRNPSSSEEKYRVLPTWIATDRPDYIISISTAESADAASQTSSRNGSVFIGGSFFLHNADTDNPESHLDIPTEGLFFANDMDEGVFSLFGDGFERTVVEKFIPAVNRPAEKMSCLASPRYAAVGVVNVTDYSKYGDADKRALERFRAKVPSSQAEGASIETTHGVVRLSSDKPTLFISPITDRLGSFAEDVTDTQNYIAAFNAGIVAGEMLVALNAYLAT